MDENSALIEAILREQEEEEEAHRRRMNHTTQNNNNNKNNEWKTVSYQKRNRNKSSSSSLAKQPLIDDNSAGDRSSDVFRSVEKHSEERRQRLMETQIAAEAASSAAAPSRSKRHSDEEDDSDAEHQTGAVQHGSSDVKKVKQKKPKKPKVTVAEAASKINADDLGAFLAEITASYDSQQDIQMMRFADYFARAFSSVTSAQFPWLKTFKESTVAKIVDIPLSHISDDIYKMSTDWIGHRSPEAIGSFVLWSLDSILADLANHQGVAKGSKKVVQQSSLKSQVAMFVVLAMVLRRKPDVMISLLPIMKESQKYQGQDKLPVTIWVIAQASQGDLVTGLYLWAALLLPILSGKSCNPQSRDLILQLVERIITFPKARTILINGAVRKGERVVPPWALDSLMRVTFPLPSARVKATERLEAVYPTLKEVALTGSPGSKAIKHLAQQILSFAIKAAGEANHDLSKEASDIFIWCVTQNPECYKQWDSLYLDNLEASVVVLRKLSDEWKEHFVKHSTLDPLRETLKSFSQKNTKALDKVVDDGAHHALLKDADKYCKAILRRLSQGNGCMKSMAFISVALAVGAVFMSQNMHSWDFNKLSEMVNQYLG